MSPASSPDPAGHVDAFETTVRCESNGWTLRALIDGQWRAVSTHATEDLARQAQRELSDSANPPEDTGTS